MASQRPTLCTQVFRLVSLLVLALFLYFAWKSWQVQKPSNVIYASRYASHLLIPTTRTNSCERYSKEHKFRPAASPIITEILSDGRTRIRGAQPTVR